MLDAAFGDRAVYLRPSSTLVLADLHVGRAAASNVAAPLDERGELVGRLDRLLDAFSPREVVFAGDVLHAFDHVPEAAPGTLSTLVDCCVDADATPVLVAGNHDRLLSTVVDDAGLAGDVHDGRVHETYRPDGSTLVCHGHVEPDAEASLYVVGHDHPAITIEGQKRPCFLYGPDTYRGGDVLLVPAATPLAAGVVVNGLRTAEFQSPLVVDADALRPLVHDDAAGETFTFPPLERFRRLL